MAIAFFILVAISVLMLVAAVVILMGKGDDFIVGYNLASNKTRALYHTRRVRIIAAVFLIVLAALLPTLAVLLVKGYNELVKNIIPMAIFVLLLSIFFLTQFWARKKDNK